MANNKDIEPDNLSDLDRQFVQRALQDDLLKRSLVSGLRRAGNEHANDQRAAWEFAVDTVANFLLVIGVEPKLVAPFNTLVCALNDLQYGIVDAGLKPGEFVGGPRAPINQFLPQVMAAVTVTLLHEEAHVPIEQALKEASKLSGIPKRKLEQFRKNTLSGRRSWKAKEFYWVELRHLRKQIKTPEQRVDYMREWFANGGHVPKKVP
jgi:hypothetical protein